jgi:spore germination protein KC
MKKIIILFLGITLFLSGCYDRREINQLAIVNSDLFDYQNGKYVFIAEAVNPKTQSIGSSGGGGQNSPYIYVKGEGSNLLDALYNANTVSNKALYTAHVKAIFVTEKMAREKGIIDIFETLSRYRDSRQGQYLIIIKGSDGQNLFNASTALSDYFGDYTEEIHQAQNNRLFKTVFVKTLDVMKDYYNNGKQPVLGVVEKIPVTTGEDTNIEIQEKQKDNYKLNFEGAAVFKEAKLINFINGDDTELYNIILGKLNSMLVTIDKTTFKIKETNPKFIFNYKNKKVKINIQINLKAVIENDLEKRDFSNPKTIAKLQDKLNKKMQEKLDKFIIKTQKEIGVDFLGLGSKLHISKPKIWKKLRKKWDEYFAKAEINIKISSDIIGEGKITKSFKLED